MLKSVGGFEIEAEKVTYMVKCAFYGSEFYKELFKDETVGQQYEILKCYYSNNPQSFTSLLDLAIVLSKAETVELISKHISKLTQPSE